ncbi:DUF4129 domain-containing protein [Lysobacter silvisoli]|uniref:DUF4129 domain-containing protein n=1 Tax=Lysobacter silvisoli TaxID=2293254 RepID=A0A371JXN7_9GAMM|nr:DUF4129 domain-containing protein [Lysobacter silvisoli]RDZ26404.1 DUF4129 domain-containing protein [Lysobacter silvisoli]
MKIESITVALRPRTAWEAVELGSALTRRHAAAIWKPYLLLTLPVFVLLNAAAWALDMLWLAGLLMWWLKPVFDRVPLYVLSRAVFGTVPGTRETLRMQWSWGARWWLPYLTWRRLSPARSLYLPVDLLEGGRGAEARRRRAALGAPVYGVAALLTLVCVHFEVALYLGGALASAIFIPKEYLAEVGQGVWQALLADANWLQLVGNALVWLAAAAMAPFYVGAGFGLYLNRRTEIEGWDIEIVFRRLRARLSAGATALLLALCLSLSLAPEAAAQSAGTMAADAAEQDDAEAMAADDEGAAIDAPDGPVVAGAAPLRAPVQPDDEDEHGKPVDSDPEALKKANAKLQAQSPPTLDEVFGDDRASHDSLDKAVKQAYLDPTVTPKRKVTQWKLRNPDKKPKEFQDNPALAWLGAVFAAIGKYGLWVLVGTLAALLLVTAPRWLRWLRNSVSAEQREPEQVHRAASTAPEPLPDNVPAAARRLWQAGRQRDALALLYRASVEAMAERAQVVLVPGATEAECLRASRRMPLAEDREAFASTVRTWQYAAYAQRLPALEEFDALLGLLSRRFGWAA